jgi:GMP synthase (glutamine-hydrolysing)
MKLVHADATERFLKALAGVTDPEEKRHRIGETFIRVFEEEADKLGSTGFIAQGTTYPDVIESASSGSSAAVKIKTHHNVGGLPKELTFELVEPLRFLFKDEVRQVGLELGLPEEMVFRHPFPGPGLAIRIIGEVTPEKLETLRSADWVVMDEIKEPSSTATCGRPSPSSPTPAPSASWATTAHTATSSPCAPSPPRTR